MSLKNNKCNHCGAGLVKGKSVKRESAGSDFFIEIINIPVQVCPSGCAGIYWQHLDLGVEVFDILSSQNENMAKRKFAFFKSKNICRNCETELIESDVDNKFIFTGKLQNGDTLELIIKCKSLECKNCEKKFIPKQKSSADKYYSALADVISAALTKDLIYQ